MSAGVKLYVFLHFQYYVHPCFIQIIHTVYTTKAGVKERHCVTVFLMNKSCLLRLVFNVKMYMYRKIILLSGWKLIAIMSAMIRYIML